MRTSYLWEEWIPNRINIKSRGQRKEKIKDTWRTELKMNNDQHQKRDEIRKPTTDTNTTEEGALEVKNQTWLESLLLWKLPMSLTYLGMPHSNELSGNHHSLSLSTASKKMIHCYWKVYLNILSSSLFQINYGGPYCFTQQNSISRQINVNTEAAGRI